MAEELKINKDISLEKQYDLLLKQIESLVNSEEPVISNLSNITAALKQTFNKISWVGFYIKKDESLYLGPFQGNIACSIIKIGSGVCGDSAKEIKTIVVENVHEYPGHIACDAGSNSEIVVPIVYNNELFGVLDIDSYDYSSFNETDKIYLEKLCKLISEKLNLDTLTI